MSFDYYCGSFMHVEQGTWLQHHLAVSLAKVELSFYSTQSAHSSVACCVVVCWTRVGVLNLLRFRGFGRIIMTGCSACLRLMLLVLLGLFVMGDVSSACVIWSSVAETALADSYCFAGGPVVDRGLVLGRGTARFRIVGFGGLRVCKVRGNVVDPLHGSDVHMYRDSSIAPILDLRRGCKAV